MRSAYRHQETSTMTVRRQAILQEIKTLQEDAEEARAAAEDMQERIRELFELLNLEDDEATTGAWTEASTVDSGEETGDERAEAGSSERTPFLLGDKVELLTGLDKGSKGKLVKALDPTPEGKPKWRIRLTTGTRTWRLEENLQHTTYGRASRRRETRS